MHLIEQTACDLLTQGQVFVLATIVRHEGATPRIAGSKMIITPEGQGIGTIGGGLLEAEAMSRARRLIGQGQSELMHFDLSGDLVTTTDMVCGGSVDVLLACVSPTAVNVDLFCRWRRIHENDRRGCLVTVAQPDNGALYRTTHCLATVDGKIAGRFPLGRSAMERVLTTTRTANRIESLWFEEALVVVEPPARVSAAYLFGGGHVARPTAYIAAMVGFQVWVLDDRVSYAKPGTFSRGAPGKRTGQF